MQIQILAFAQAAEQLGFRECAVDCSPHDSAAEVMARLAPGFATSNVRVAVDHEYHAWDEPLGEAREIAIIPPVSGG